jgi:hypothetical protein
VRVSESLAKTYEPADEENTEISTSRTDLSIIKKLEQQYSLELVTDLKHSNTLIVCGPYFFTKAIANQFNIHTKNFHQLPLFEDHLTNFILNPFSQKDFHTQIIDVGSYTLAATDFIGLDTVMAGQTGYEFLNPATDITHSLLHGQLVWSTAHTVINRINSLSIRNIVSKPSFKESIRNKEFGPEIVFHPSAYSILEEQSIGKMLEPILNLLKLEAHKYNLEASKIEISGFIDPEENAQKLVVTQWLGVGADIALDYWEKLGAAFESWISDLNEETNKILSEKVAVEVRWEA